jgi:hypothetical protein
VSALGVEDGLADMLARFTGLTRAVYPPPEDRPGRGLRRDTPVEYIQPVVFWTIDVDPRDVATSRSIA